MKLPSFWRQAAFSVVESARLLAVPEDTLRTWMARVPFNDFMGAKTGGRIFLSAHDLYFWSIVRDMSAYGVGLRVAMHSAQTIADAARYDMPNDERLVVRKTAPDVWHFEIFADPDVSAASALVIPLRAMAHNLIGSAAVVYAGEDN